MKKVKLFTTIASLCLAVALMAFGVYAAAINSVAVSGTIHFTSSAQDGYFSQVEITNEQGCSVRKEEGEESAVKSKTGDNSTEGELKIWSGINIDVTADTNSCSFDVVATYVNVGSTKDITVTAVKGTEAAGVTYTLVTETATAFGTENAGAHEVTVTIRVNYTTEDPAQNATPAWNVSFTAE